MLHSRLTDRNRLQFISVPESSCLPAMRASPGHARLGSQTGGHTITPFPREYIPPSKNVLGKSLSQQTHQSIKTHVL